MALPKYKNLEHSGQTGSKSVTVCKLNSHAQSHTPTQTFTKKLHWIGLLNCTIRSTVLANYCAHSSSFSCATCWHDCQLTKKKDTLAEILDSHWGPKQCQLDITADPRGVEEKLEDITVHLRGDTVQWIVTIKRNSFVDVFFLGRGLTIIIRDPIEPD